MLLFCQVVELLLTRGANKEHRNVSDYTPLSLAASGGYVNIIKLLLAHGAEINSRTGSKLGISPLMLAAMNGHTGKFTFMFCHTNFLVVCDCYKARPADRILFKLV
jgi:ankyrin repeat protein